MRLTLRKLGWIFTVLTKPLIDQELHSSMSITQNWNGDVQFKGTIAEDDMQWFMLHAPAGELRRANKFFNGDHMSDWLKGLGIVMYYLSKRNADGKAEGQDHPDTRSTSKHY